jgi:hypothetical protein
MEAMLNAHLNWAEEDRDKYRQALVEIRERTGSVFADDPGDNRLVLEISDIACAALADASAVERNSNGA